MATENRIDFKVRVTDEGLAPLASNLEKVEDAAGALGDKAQSAGAQLDGLADAAAQTGAQSQRLDSRSGETAAAIKRVGDEAQEASQDVKGLGGGLKDMAAQTPQLNAALSSVSKAIAGLYSLNKAKDFALDTIALADAYGQMAERIQMATPVAEEYDLVQARILQTANLTYRRLEEQQELYIRTADALRGMAYNTEEVLDITDSFSYLLTTNAATVERGKNAIDAYTKSIQSGRIEVDSWQSIMSATPTIVNAVAQATGKTADEVRRLGITGKLSINDLNEGLRQTVALNKEAAAGMSATVADAITRLTNTWSQYVGEANRANQSTEKIVRAVDLLSENLDTVVGVAIQAGEVMAVVWAIKALNALKAYTAQLAVAATQTTAVMAATTAAADRAAAGLVAAGKVAAAGWLGWEIGTYLKDEFEVVERAGIALAAGMTKVAAIIQANFEVAKAVFSDDTIAAAQQRLADRLAQIDDEYADMFANVGRGLPMVAAETQKLGDAAAEAASRVRISASDMVEAWEAARIAKVGDAQAAEANLRVQLKLAQHSEQMALLMGNETEARNAKILQMEIEIELVTAKVAVQRAEAEGAIAVAQAKLAEMAANKEVNLVKQAELENVIKLAQAKLAEADATGKSTDLLRRQLDLLRSGSGSADGYRGSIDGLAGAQGRLARSTNEATEALQRQKDLYASPLGDDKYSRPTGGSIVPDSREAKLAGQAATDERLRFELLAKLKAGTLSEDDLSALKSVVSVLKANQRIFDSLPIGASSLDALSDDRKWEAARVGFEQAIANLEGRAGTPSAGAAAVGSTHTVHVNLGNGRARSINTASEADAGELAGLLKELETSQRRSR